MNFANHVDVAARNRPDVLAVADPRRARTFRELADGSNRIARGLQRRGVAVGEPVAVFMPNGVPFVTTYLGIIKLGALPLPVNTRFTDQQIRYVVRDSGAVAAVADDQVDGVVADDLETVDYADLLDDGDPHFEIEPRRSEEHAELLYTSGTTGAPKGVYHTQGNLAANATAFIKYMEWSREAVALTVCQCFHVTGLNITTTPFLVLEAENHLLPEWDAETVLSAIERHGVTFTFLIPTMLMDVLEHDDVAAYDLSTLRTVAVGGSPMPRKRIDEAESALGCTLLEGYGMTETTPLATFNRPIEGGRRPGSIGRPIAEAVEVRIEDPKTGDPVDGTDRGEFLWRGDTVSPGYNSPQLDDQGFVVRDGKRWLKSGDIGWEDDEGFLYVVDRYEDMFTTGCGDVYPREIEEVIYGIPAVEKAAIIDAKDDIRGATVTAIVKTRADESVAPARIKRACRRELEIYEVPDRVEFVEAFPRTATGKVDRVTLRDRFD
jgi:acyl-CoA synthetase (AMP-forming)/AMP-acid ligase II